MFTVQAVRSTATYDGTKYSGAEAGSSAIDVRFDAGTGRYTLATPGVPELELASASTSNALYETYRSSDAAAANLVLLSRQGPQAAVDTHYVRSGLWIRSSGPSDALFTQVRAFNFGVLTPAFDVPRTGTGSFSVLLDARSGGFGGLTQIDGSGLFEANFGTGQWTLDGTATSRSIVTGFDGALVSFRPLTGGGTLRSATNGFDGTIGVGGMSPIAAVPLAGSFYGPGAAELGAIFGSRTVGLGGNTDTFLVGSLIGARGTNAPPIETLASLLGPVYLRRFQSSVRVNTDMANAPSVEFNGSIESSLTIDPAAQTLQFDGSVTLGPGNKIAGESDRRFSVYHPVAGSSNPTYRVYNPGVGNDELPLDYVGFALSDAFGVSANTFGLISAFDSLPRSGRGTFTGVFYGNAFSAGPANRYMLSGAASLVADFGAQTIGGGFSATAKSVSGEIIDLGRFDLTNGHIGAFNRFTSSALSGNVITADLSGTPGAAGSLIGNFFGPRQEELGATVKLITPAAGLVLIGDGAIVAKRGLIDAAPVPAAPAAPAGPANASLDPLTASDTFQAYAERASAFYPANGTSPINARSTNLTVRYDAATQSYTVEEAGSAASFSPADRSARSNRLYELFGTSTGSTSDTLRLTRTGPQGATGTRYAGGGIWLHDGTAQGVRQVLMRSFSYGIATAVADIPTTGSASFGVVLTGVQAVGQVTTPPGLASINGSGLLTIDWANRQVTGGGVTYTRSPLPGGAAPLLIPGTFEYNGIALPTGGLDGFMTVGNAGNTGSGTADGRLYGPGAAEVGIAYSVSSGTPIRSGVGVVTGARGTVAPAFETMSTLLSDVTLSGFQGEVRIPSAGAGPPAEGSSVQTSIATVGAALDTYQIGNNQLTSANLVPAESNGRFATYRTSNGTGTTTTRVYRVGSGNAELQLSYASLAISDFIVQNAGNLRVSDTYAFGLPTLGAALPRTGAASYQGVAYGSGYVASATNDAYTLRGTTSLDINWAQATFTGGLALTAAKESTGVVETLGALSFTAGSLNRATAGFNATIGGGAGVSGSLIGSFFGPTGQELGAAFRFDAPVAGGTLQAQGALVGVKN